MITTDALKLPATNGSRPIASGRLCGGTVSEVFHTREWIASCYLNEIPSNCLART